MPKLSDSQLAVLTAACGRDDGAVYPLTSNVKGGAADRLLKSLLGKGLIEEIKAKRTDTVWRQDEEEGSFTLRGDAGRL